MSKQVQIPLELLLEIYDFICEYRQKYEIGVHYTKAEKIEKALNAKLDKLANRELFSQYKIANAGSDEREEARQTYLNKIGIRDNWRSNKELKHPE